MANGQIPSSELARIHNGMLLRKDAAVAFNAMDEEAVARYGRHIGVRDAYRPLGSPGDLNAGRWSQWAAWERYQRGGNLAARPGTSNHGEGIAVDLYGWSDREIVDKLGEKYGFAKKWSDAPGEWWHIKWRAGVYKPPPADPLRVLTIHERYIVNRLNHWRRKMTEASRAADDRSYRTYQRYAEDRKAQVRKQMDAIKAAARRSGPTGGWDKFNRGSRYQVLGKVYTRKIT